MIRSFVLAIPLLILATIASAVDAPPSMKAFVETEIMSWAASPEVIEAVKAKNEKTAGFTEDDILKLDTQWRGEVGQADQPLIGEVMNNDLSTFLSEHVAASGGQITELFVMNAQGLNVGASDVTSDYWQGDEDKHAKTYGVGPGEIFVDAIEFDESSQTYQGQVSVSLTDPDTGAVVGAMTIGLNAEAFF
ncbi:hypothetical protein [Roseobacter sp.]|uniref:hypothetical protein n=1 Tax=Roseobacter sp. TaxID=1907202 RepID=UPI0032990BE0